jgi:hypothetical protein
MKMLRLVPEKSGLQKRLTVSWVRNMVVMNQQPMSDSLPSATVQFLRDYSLTTGADFCWEGPKRRSARDVIESDLKAFRSKALLICIEFRHIQNMCPTLRGDSHRQELKSSIAAFVVEFVGKTVRIDSGKILKQHVYFSGS